MKRFKAPKKLDYNLAVIGAGSAGLVSAYIGCQLNAKVALIEKNKMGGDCLHTGCVPSKALIRSANVLNTIKHAKSYGLNRADVDFEFADVMERVQRVIQKIEPHDSVERYTDLGVDCIQGTAKILTPYRIEVGDQILTTKNIIVATGAGPLVPPIPGLDQVTTLTSDSVWNLRELPKRLLVVGGGPIGLELAQSFHRLGARVTLVEALPRIIAVEDEDVSAFLTKKLQDEGVTVLTNHMAKSFGKSDNSQYVICECNKQEVKVEFDAALIALGRRPNTKGFGLEDLQVQLTDKGFIKTDDYMRATYPSMFACGDVVGPYLFTHAASHQAWYAAVNALFRPLKKFKVDYRVIPWATYTDPEVAHVGLNVQEAGKLGLNYEVTTYDLSELDRAVADEADHGFVKVVTPKGKDKILGVTIVGAHAGDLIAEFVLAMKHGLGLNKILGTIHAYPTWAEANKYAAGVWRKAHKPEGVLRFLKKFHTWRRR